MKTNLLFKWNIILILLCSINLKSQAKCSITLSSYNSQGSLGSANMPVVLNLTLIPGDTITMNVHESGCSVVAWGGWYYNGSLITGTVGFNSLSIVPQAGVYTVSFTCGGCLAPNPSVYFNIIFITTGIIESGYSYNLSFYPVPANNNLTISFSSIKESDYTFMFANALGNVVKEYTLQHLSGDFKQEEDLSGLADGVYFLSVHNKDIIEKRRFLKISQ